MEIPVINLSDLNGTNGFRLDGEKALDESGFSVSNAGDVNGDGFDDVIVGASGRNLNGGSASGSSYVVFGKASGFNAVMNLSSLDGANGFRVDAESTYDYSSASFSDAGDVNGDGFDDLFVRAFGFDLNGGSAVSTYVVFGKTSGFDAALDLSSLDGNNGFRLDGAAASSNAGVSASNAGDVNGDGFDDLIVGDFSTDLNGTDSGSSYVVFGKASGFDVSLDLLSLDGSNGFRLDGEGAGDLSGRAVSGAGDVNGDGFDDVIIGARGANDTGYYSASGGASYVVFGKASGFSAAMDLSSLDGSNGLRLDGKGLSGSRVSSAGDINGDGFDDVLVGTAYTGRYGQSPDASYVVFGKASGFDATMNLSNLDGNNGFILFAGAEMPYNDIVFNSAGDINGDGFDDLIVGEYRASPNGYESGSSHVVFGKASGFDAKVVIPRLGRDSDLRLDGAAAGDAAGRAVSNAGDINGDGFDDLIVGAPGADPNGIYSGSSYVIFGRSDFGGGGGNVIAGTPGDDVLKGTSGADIFEAGDGNDLMVGRGGADVFKAGAGNDKITVTDLDFASVAGGAGNGLNLDLADFGANISGIETFCLFGQGDNTLTLTAADLLNLSDTSDTLKVNGNAAGHIIVEDSGWIDEGSRGSGYYHAYTNEDAVLLVGQNITVDFAVV